MGRMSELALEIEDLSFEGLTMREIAEELEIPIEWVAATLQNLEENYDDSMDGDFDSAMTSVGWGTDEDYGGDCDML